MMNPHTGELRALRGDEKMPEGFEQVPRGGLEAKQAFLKLRLAAVGAFAAAAMSAPAPAPAPSAHVNLRGGSPLAMWAKKKRKAKIAAASRRRNRK